MPALVRLQIYTERGADFTLKGQKSGIFDKKSGLWVRKTLSCSSSEILRPDLGVCRRHSTAGGLRISELEQERVFRTEKRNQGPHPQPQNVRSKNRSGELQKQRTPDFDRAWSNWPKDHQGWPPGHLFVFWVSRPVSAYPPIPDPFSVKSAIG